MNSDTSTIGPTPERLRMAGEDVDVFTPDKNEHWRAIRLLDGHVLASLSARGQIDGEEYEAGLRFYWDWYQSGLANSGVIDPGRVIVDGGKMEPMSDRKMAAMTRFQKALQHLGMIESLVLTDILLAEWKLEDWARARLGRHKSDKLARNAATAALRVGLKALDAYYNGPRRNPTRSAHMPDYKPRVMPAEEQEIGG